MSLVLAWLRLELRRRWRSLAVLALLIAIASATVLTAVAGARRADTAVDRLLAQTLPADASVVTFQPNSDWAGVRGLPEVEALATIALGVYTVNGIFDAQLNRFLPVGADALYTVERPAVLDGRLADPARADEAVVTADFVQRFGLGVGDTVRLGLYAPGTVDPVRNGARDAPPPTAANGPVLPVHIVGVVRSFFFADELGGGGALIPSPALAATYRANLGPSQLDLSYGIVRLRAGADLAALRAGIARVSGSQGVAVSATSDRADRARDVLRFEAAYLLAFGLAALLAAVFLVGQSIARYTAATVVDLQVLRALGTTSGQAVRLAAAAPVLTAAAGATIGVAAAVVGSRWLPIGAAAVYEPAPGVDVDALVLGAGWVLILALVLAGAGVAALSLDRTGRDAPPRRSVVADAAARAGLGVPVTVGVRFALEPGRGRSAVPVRPALLGAVVGVLGVLAAFTVAAGVGDAAEHPQRFGQSYSGVINLGNVGQEIVAADPVLSALAAAPDVRGVVDMRYAVAHSGQTTVTIYSYDPVGPPVPPVITEGALPQAADEIMLGPTSARRLGATVGSSVTLSGDAGTRALRVTGVGFTLEGTDPDDISGNGAWVTAGGYRALFGTFVIHGALFALRPGVDPAAAIPRLQQALDAAPGVESAVVRPLAPPRRFGQIQNVRVLPVLLGGFLALLAVGAVGHALATAVRRRRHDVAVLRALGMTRRQCRGVVITQATVLAVIGLAFGIPLGLALGRTVWRLVADLTPLQYVPPAALPALAVTVPLALLIVNLLAAVLGRRAARLPVSQILRAE